MFRRTPGAEEIKRRIDQWSSSIKSMELDLRNREDNKEVSLGTSKINYMDPRISVAWCKRCEVPIERVILNFILDHLNRKSYIYLRFLQRRCVINLIGQWQYLATGNLNKIKNSADRATCRTSIDSLFDT